MRIEFLADDLKIREAVMVIKLINGLYPFVFENKDGSYVTINEFEECGFGDADEDYDYDGIVVFRASSTI